MRLKTPDASHHHHCPVNTKYARNCSEELSHRCLQIYKAIRVAVDNQRARLLAAPLLKPASTLVALHSRCLFSLSFVIISSLMFVNLLGSAPAPNLLDVLPPSNLVGFSLDCGFCSLKPRPISLDFAYSRTGRSSEEEEAIVTSTAYERSTTIAASIGTQTLISYSLLRA
jgi:hypothetical protein